MHPNIAGAFDRADELKKDLLAEYQKCLAAKVVSQRAIQLTHEIMEKLRGILDRSARLYWERKVGPALSAQDRDRASVYFPICDDRQAFDSTLGRWCWKSVRNQHQAICDFLQATQPFTGSQNKWLATIGDLAIASKHIDLVPQKAIEIRRIVVSSPGGGGMVSWDPNSVRFGTGVRILGVPVDPRTQRVVPNSILEERHESWVSFEIAKHGVNAAVFCTEAIDKTRALVSRMFKDFNL